MYLLEKNKGLWFNFLELFPLVILEKAFWFLLLILIINLRNIFIFYINVATDEKNKGVGVHSFTVNSFCSS